ncbi:MCAT [Symbiodinium sp. CCMP2456]|nr:MCAT [Symbiodinium sp. CCMP2456]
MEHRRASFPSFSRGRDLRQRRRIGLLCPPGNAWAYDANWSTSDFHFIHSAGHSSEDKVGGLLIMVSVRLAKSSDIQFHAVHPGRLLRVRVNRAHPIDILNIYQYTANDNRLTPARRQQYLTRLQKTLRRIPNRHVLIAAGDYNTTCVPTDKVCGPWTMPPPERHHKESGDLMAIFSAHALSVLNTWNRPTHRQLATFTFGDLSSQIDYIVCRQSQATSRAKQAEVLLQFPVACWREGATHHPVLAHIDVPVQARQHQTAEVRPAINVQQLIEDVRSAQPPEALRELRGRVQQGLSQAHWADLQHLEKDILVMAGDLYPKQRPGTTTQDKAVEELHTKARVMWGLFRSMRAQPFTVQGVITAWQQWATFSCAHREHKARAKERSKARKRDLLNTAQQAAQRGGMHQVWKVVQTLAPKIKRKPLQLYKEGRIMAPEAELDWIIEAFGERYGARSPPCTKHIRTQPPVQVSAAEVWHHLERLPVRKAVPKAAAPSVLWKACSAEVAPFIAQQVNSQWSSEELHVDQDWANATVALLPKPKGKNDRPLDWRPIGLQHPVGKGLMKILIGRAKDQIHEMVCHWPQCAYVPRRNTFTALKRVLNHCRTVRDQAARHRLSIHQQREGVQQIPSSGGLQICMDLTAAFDLVSWGTIREALELAQVDPSTQEVLLRWLSQVKYIFQHKDLTKELWPSWGLRQGCIGSPVLWSAFTALLCQALDNRMHQTWISDHATLYADDSHLRWTFRSVAQFDHAIQELRWTFAIFRCVGMKINQDKTQAILSVTGNIKHKIHKLYVRKQGGVRRLLLSPGDPSQWIPLVDKAEYLGLIISYDQFEWQSVRHRVSKAHNRRWALASILHARRVSIPYKLRLWRSCVLSTMMYALHCLCLQPGQLQFIQRAIMKHVRAIASDQAFITGNTHAEVSRRHEVQTAHELINKAHNNELRIAQLGDWLIEHDYNQAISQCLLQDQLQTASDSEEDREVWACPVCLEQFPTTAALKVHARRKHKIVDAPAKVFDRTKHSIAGLPQCSGCLKKFSRWQTLEWHINHHACPALSKSDEASAICEENQRAVSDKAKPTTATPAPSSDACGDPMNSVDQHPLNRQTPLIQQHQIQDLVERGLEGAPPQVHFAVANLFYDFAEGEKDNGPNKRRRAFPHMQAPPHQRSDPLLHTLAKTVLRQQEEIRLLRQDTALIIFLKPGQDSILHHLYQVAVQFKAKQEAEPIWSLGQFPLRMVLANALFRELIERLNKVLASQERLKTVMDQGWRDDKGWRFQSTTAAVRPYRTISCWTIWKLTETMTSPATFKMDISLRSHSALTMWDTMRTLQGNTIFQLVGMGYKTESLGRGPEEQRLRDMVYGRR